MSAVAIPGAERDAGGLPEAPASDLAVEAPAVARSQWGGRAWLVVLCLAAGGLALRLLTTRGLWVDEAISVDQAQMSFEAMLDDLQRTDRHPPLHYGLLWLAVRAFGDGELAVRIPSIVAGTLLVPTLFACGRELYDRRTGLVAAALGALAPLAIWYSQEARMYSLFMLFSAASLWALVRAVRNGRAPDWAAYALAAIALLWTHYFGVLIVAVEQAALAAVAWHRARNGVHLRPLLLGCVGASIAIVLVVGPLVPFMHRQLAVSEVIGMGFSSIPSQAAPEALQSPAPSIYALVSNFAWAVWGYHSDSTMLEIAALWPAGMLLALLLLGRGRSGTTLLVGALAVVPPLALFVFGFLRHDLFDVRYFAGSVPMLLLLLARGMSVLSASRRAAALGTAVLLATLVVGLADQQLNASNPRLFNFRDALRDVARRAEPGDLVIYSPRFLRDVVRYYAPQARSAALGPRPAKPPPNGRTYLVASFLEEPRVASRTGAAVYALRREQRLVRSFRHERIHIWVFAPGA